jgi:hypothetical protein
VATGDAVEWPAAVDAWVNAARPVLVAVACTYGGYIKYGDLAEQIQVAAGVRTRKLLPNWIGDVLGAVAAAQPADEPMLTSLVVHADGTIGDGYGIPVEQRDGVRPADLDMHAAIERLECYRFFGADMPADGGSPTLTAEVSAFRARSTAAGSTRPTCPTCHLRLPASGRCDACDE